MADGQRGKPPSVCTLTASLTTDGYGSLLIMINIYHDAVAIAWDAD